MVEFAEVAVAKRKMWKKLREMREEREKNNK